MKNLLNVALAASGTPSEVNEKIAGQVQAIAGADTQIVGAMRQYIDSKIKGESEDQTISVTATVSIDLHEIPAVVTKRREAELEAFAADKRVIQIQLDAANKALAEARKPGQEK